MTGRTGPRDPGRSSAPPRDSSPKHVELFAGAGGMAIGCRQAGFTGPAEFYELNKHCCRTLDHNIKSATPTLVGTVHEGDVQAVQWDGSRRVRLLAGGAPCQPFSIAGRHAADSDERNMFPEVFRAMRALRPDAILLENVRGLLRPDFRPYFDYVLAQIADPAIAPRGDESWEDHYDRILRHQRSRGYEPEYAVSCECLNAADYGVPQERFRVFIVAVRAGLPPYAFPPPSHSRTALVAAQWTAEYWEARGVPRPRKVSRSGRVRSTDRHPELNEILARVEGSRTLRPWVTVRDALAGLPAPAKDEDSAEMNHWVIPGARQYHGHKGSHLDWPSKTIKAGVNGVAGGENAFTDARGVFRYYTLREAARLQTFPDDHVFMGARSRVIGQIGNAVPCRLAAAVARPLYELLEGPASGAAPANGRAAAAAARAAAAAAQKPAQSAPVPPHPTLALA